MIQTKEEKMLASASARLTASTFIFNKRANAAKSNKAENTIHEQQKQQHYHHHHHYHYRAAAATAAAAAEKNQCGTRRAVVATTQPMALYMQIAKLLRIPSLSLYNISPNKRKMSDSPGKSAASLQYTAHTTSASAYTRNN
ncbi:unnamed protein product [Trichogramma brassicae]|uniref:Uncharacterized protein n=1 Tax=Trichogramma brassicae TaxID=86971 RepID=A0A6H5IEZ9_9HYME|nr:unnamed protein product [Trichogramma brassicae]